ncbi:MAG: ferrochelatase [Sandaracinaceae bacterium]
MASPSPVAFPRLEALDRRLDERGVLRLTVAPGRTLATPLASLARSLDVGPELADALSDGLFRTVEAIGLHFPENVFWDLDGLVATAVREADSPVALSSAFDDIVALHALFGAQTPIRFRYVHDFVYGFDWARWTARDPASRAGIHPYSRRFLAVMLERGARLLEQIAEADRKYPPLSDARHRNPFGFSREPEDETRLHRALARDGMLPIEAWSTEAAAHWDRPYTELRDRQAEALGMLKRTSARPPSPDGAASPRPPRG